MNKKYFNSEKNTEFAPRKSKFIGLFLMVLFFFIFANTVSAQTTGDYRSLASGSWTTPESWEYYNGSAWVTSTTSYPGQNSGTYAVLIQPSHTITIGTSGITTQPMGTVTISGTLFLNANNSDTNYNLTTTTLVVTPNLTPKATIDFDKKSHLVLPAAAELQVSTGGLSGQCNNNIDISIGSTVISYCSGGSPSFSTVMTQGGYNTAGTLSGNQSVCVNGTTTFSSTASGGTWSSSSTSVATVNSSGVVTGVAAGSSIISYTLSGVISTRAVYVGAPSAAGFITGTTPQCPGLTNQTYSIAAVNGATSYVWYVPSGWTITTGQGTTSITVTTGTSNQSGNIQVNAVNSCGTGYANGEGNGYKYVNVNSAINTASPTVRDVAGNCGYVQLDWNQVSGAIGYYLDIATDTGFTNFVAGFNNFKGTYNGSYNFAALPTGTLYYRIRAYDYCAVSNNSNRGTITVTGATNSGTLASSQTICSGTKPADLVVTGNTSAVTSWEYSTNIDFNPKQTINSTATTLTGTVIGNLTQSTYFRAVTSQMTSSPWCQGYSTVVLITVTNSVLAASSSPTPCINTAMTTITHTTSGFTGIGTPINLPAGVTASFAANTITISGTPSASGTFNYSIPLTGGSCGGSPAATGTITVTPAASAGTVTVGTSPQCISGATTYTVSGQILGGGTGGWTSSNTAIATVVAGTGVVTAVGAGTCNIIYTVTGGCGGTKTASQPFTVTATASAGTVTAGTSPQCVGGTTTYTVSGQILSGGTGGWSSDNTAIATVIAGTGVVTAVSSGTCNVVYTVTGGCGGTKTASKPFTVTTTASAGTVTAGTSPQCVGGTTTYTVSGQVLGGGTGGWSSDNTAIATVIAGTGVVTAVSSGTCNIIYTVTGGCGGTKTASQSFTVTATASAGTVTAGTSPQCVGGTTTYTVSGQILSGGTGGWSSDNTAIATVIAGTGVVTAVSSGTCNIIYTVTGGCGGTKTASQPFTVTATASAGTVTAGTSPQCVGGTSTYTVSGQVLGGGTGGWSSDNTAIATVVAGTGVVTAVSAGTCNIVYTVTGGCGGTKTASQPFTVKALLTTPTGGTLTQPTCATATGSVLLNNLPTSGLWSLYQDNVDIYDATGGSGSVTISDLAATGSGTTYNFKVSNGVCTSAVVSVTINPVLTTKWNGGSWDNGEPNTSNSNRNIVFDGDFTIANDVVGCSCEVKGTRTITVAAGKVLKVQNGLNVQGTLIFENGASLVQENDLATNSGSITYKRTTSTVNDYDYVYWSSPVAGRTLGQLSPTSDKYWSWLINNWAPAKATDVMLPAKGYIVRVPLGTSPQNVVFLGTPNNGVKTIASQGVNKSNLIGNPYPSALDADLFINYNKTIINGALYFWTHTKPRVYDSANNQYVYASNDYALYTLFGGTASGSGSAAPSSNIAAGQSFFVESKRSGNFTFNNSMRVSTTGENNHFLKQASTKKGIASDRDRIWLNLTNDGGAFKQLLVGYMVGATNDFDNLYDGTTLDGNTFVDFYSIANDKNYGIQARGLPFSVTDEIPLGYKTTVAGTFTIAIDNFDGDFTNQDIYLEDKITNKIQNLKSGSYSFTTAIGTFTDRFVLRYTDTSKTLGTDEVQAKDGKGVIVSVKNSRVKINSFDQTISSVNVYDLKGSLIYVKNKVGQKEFSIENLATSNQFLIVMVQLEDGKWVSEEIIFHD
ncbi:hypothetical protein [Flavobacterium sp. WC2509]|uniref:hypothetical protein n=1 Tax=Flavobacterium sp. WC2509 TaxID=3461406 RepID=UPI004043DE77